MRYNIFDVFSAIGERARSNEFQKINTMRLEIRYTNNTSQSFLFNPPNMDWYTIDLFEELLPYLNRLTFFEVESYSITQELEVCNE